MYIYFYIYVTQFYSLSVTVDGVCCEGGSEVANTTRCCCRTKEQLD